MSERERERERESPHKRASSWEGERRGTDIGSLGEKLSLNEGPVGWEAEDRHELCNLLP